MGKRKRCSVGMHADYDRTPDGRLVWCLHCGRTWKAFYDGLNAGYTRARDRSFGRLTHGRDRKLVPPR